MPERCAVVPAAGCRAHLSPAGTHAILTAEQLAKIIVQSIDRHGIRGLIYEAGGATDVVMHGKVDMVAVATDVLAALKKD